MGEIAWEPAERVYVVRPQPWGPAAIDSWTKALWGHGRRWFLFGGCLFWLFFFYVAIIYITAKAMIWIGGVVAILFAQAAVAISDVATYRHRRTLAS